tara:strand:+ start:130 stop:612 length:483 start_codon:yes stop_codon:yes gene_type:complete
MIHATYGSNATFYTTTEEKRIDTAVPKAQIRYLFKFTNDLSGSVVYGYGQSQAVNDRYTSVQILHNTTDNVYEGKVNFKPNGYWTYEIYEVSWQGSSVVLGSGTAPINENDVLSPVANTKGVVQGRVELGKLLVSETAGSEEVQYTEHSAPTGTNYIYVS